MLGMPDYTLYFFVLAMAIKNPDVFVHEPAAKSLTGFMALFVVTVHPKQGFQFVFKCGADY